jgi:hypothetical protein
LHLVACTALTSYHASPYWSSGHLCGSDLHRYPIPSPPMEFGGGGSFRFQKA